MYIDDKPLFKVRSSNDAQGDSISHRFIRLNETIVTAIDKDLVNRFNIDEDTWAYQVADEIGIRLVFTKNKNTGQPGVTTQPADQDYGE